MICKDKGKLRETWGRKGAGPRSDRPFGVGREIGERGRSASKIAALPRVCSIRWVRFFYNTVFIYDVSKTDFINSTQNKKGHVMSRFLRYTILVAIIVMINYTANGQSLGFLDLPHLNWAQGFEFPGNLAWGMSPKEVQQAVGAPLQKENSYSGSRFDFPTINYDAVLQTNWNRQRVFSGSSPSKGVAALSFSYDRLSIIWIRAYKGWEDGLLQALFDQFGPAKGVGRSKIDKPVPSTADSGQEYYWLDNETMIEAKDSFGYNNVTKRMERGVSVQFIGWRVYAPKEAYEQTSQDYLFWYNLKNQH